MDRNEELNNSLVVLLKMFKNRPYHLAKYLVDNSALNNEFISKLIDSDKLKKLSNDESDNKSTVVPVYFLNISQMNDFYDSFLNDIKEIAKNKNSEEITKEINDRLDNLIRSEKFEEAARVRDYMVKKGINRLNNL